VIFWGEKDGSGVVMKRFPGGQRSELNQQALVCPENSSREVVLRVNILVWCVSWMYVNRHCFCDYIFVFSGTCDRHCLQIRFLSCMYCKRNKPSFTGIRKLVSSLNIKFVNCDHDGYKQGVCIGCLIVSIILHFRHLKVNCLSLLTSML
jgi:hypothetical protein